MSCISHADILISLPYFVRIGPYHVNFSFWASVPLCVFPSTINEELIIASNLATRFSRSFISFLCLCVSMHTHTHTHTQTHTRSRMLTVGSPKVQIDNVEAFENVEDRQRWSFPGSQDRQRWSFPGPQTAMLNGGKKAEQEKETLLRKTRKSVEKNRCWKNNLFFLFGLERARARARVCSCVNKGFVGGDWHSEDRRFETDC